MRLAAIVESSDDAIISKDLNAIIMTWNRGAERMFGYTAEEAIGQSVTMLIPTDHLNEEPQILARIRRGEPVDHYETVRRRKDGSLLDISLTVSPLRDRTGTIVGASKIARDVTEKKKADQKLYESEERYRTLFNSMDEGYCIIEVLFDDRSKAVDYRFIEINPAFEKQSGMKEVIGRRMREYVTEIEEHWLLNYGNVALTGNPIRFAGEYKGLDRSFEVYAFRVGEPSQNRVAVLFTDITARLAAEQARRQSEVRYRRLFQAAMNGILILDAQTGTITDVNAFMADLLGFEREAIVGKELHEIGMFKDTEESKEEFRRLQREKYVRYDHLPMRNARGEKVEVEVIANMYHEDETLVAQCNIRDISDRVAMQARLTLQAEQLATESRSKDEFLAMLSHELRNPLAPIRSAVHLLRSRERGDEDLISRQAREIIDRQVGNLTKLVNDLLEVSRVVSGRVRLTQQTVDLNQVLQHAVQTARPLIEERKHELLVNTCPDPVWISADSTRIEEVFINLLDNAAKYTPDGGRIEVWCEQPSGGNYAQVRIRDNGAGIDSELLPRIFELFTQADRSLARSAGGLGIGLSLAQRLVNMHGGKIEAQSPPEGAETGSEFLVKLGIADAPVESETTRDSIDGDVNNAGAGEGLRVLVVDDNIDLVMTLATTLRQKGYSVQSAYTGPSGLKTAQQWRPDIVLLDIGLPELDGYEVARRIRSEPFAELSNARLIALTGYGRDADIDMAREAGFDGHLVKPCDIEDLDRLMRSTTRELQQT